LIDTKELLKGQYMTRFGFIKAGYGSYELSNMLDYKDTNTYVMFIVMMSRTLKRVMK